jgi:hypothetical protein
MRFLCWLFVATVSFVVAMPFVILITLPAMVWGKYSDTRLLDLPRWATPFAFHEWAMTLFDLLWPRAYTIPLGDKK